MDNNLRALAVPRVEAQLIHLTLDVLKDCFSERFPPDPSWESRFLRIAYWHYREWERENRISIMARYFRLLFGKKYRDPLFAMTVESRPPQILAQLRAQSRALRYATSKNVPRKRLSIFIRNSGGINVCSRKFRQAKVSNQRVNRPTIPSLNRENAGIGPC